MPKIGPAELDARRATDDVFVLDIRPRESFRTGHIEGSQNAPVYHEVRTGDHGALDAHLDDVPTDKQVVVVCKAGIVAQDATAHLEARGYEATTLSGGYTGWRHYDAGTVPYRLVSFLSRILPF